MDAQVARRLRCRSAMPGTHSAHDWYTSGYCHAVALPDLKPGALYSYRIPPMQDTLFFFRAPKAVDGDAPTRIAVIGDMGQTQNSLQARLCFANVAAPCPGLSGRVADDG
eukprot:312115-Rhodomonas_salina.1